MQALTTGSWHKIRNQEKLFLLIYNNTHFYCSLVLSLPVNHFAAVGNPLSDVSANLMTISVFLIPVDMYVNLLTQLL